MQKVLISKVALLAKIKENLIKHVEEYNLSKINYKTKARENLEKFYQEALKEIEDGKDVSYFQQLPIPVSHEADYKTVIEMLEMSVEDEISLTQSEFKQYVQDQFSWKEQFVATSSFYNS